jgi:hypothetical protein
LEVFALACLKCVCFCIVFVVQFWSWAILTYTR